MKKAVTLKVRFENLTKAQAIALVNMFNEMERFGYAGHSAYVGFYADGDGNFHPVVKHNLRISKEDLDKYRETTLIYEKGKRTHSDATSNEKKFPWTDSISLFDFDGLNIE